MPRLRRVVAALLGVLLLQLTLQESAWACAWTTVAGDADAHGASAAAMTHEHAMAAGHDSHERAAMSASSARESGGDASVAVPARSDRGGPPCCAPDAMHGSCGTATAVTVATVVAVAAATTDHAPARWPRVADVPASLRAAPDVPPPKA